MSVLRAEPLKRSAIFDNSVHLLSGPVIGGRRTMLPLALAILIAGSGVLVLGHDLDVLPRTPAPNDGRTDPFREHRAFVFGTLVESLLVHGLLIVGLAVDAVGLPRRSGAGRTTLVIIIRRRVRRQLNPSKIQGSAGKSLGPCA